MDQADDIEVLNRAVTWIKENHRVALVTVLRTWGSSPRSPGSLMVMNDEGQYVGSVSGGCVEEALVAQYRSGDLAGPAPTLVDFGIDRQEASRMGLPCGGRLEVLIEYLASIEPIEQLLTQLRSGGLVSRRVDMNSGEVILSSGAKELEFRISETEVTKTFGPSWQLLLIGDGQLARHLASMALQLDYRVTICDPREEFAPAVPIEGVQYRRQMPDEAIQKQEDHTRTAIVTLAHDPRQDDLGLSAALETNSFYIGALGSKRTAEARRKRLLSLGHLSQQLDRIHGPAGLSIGSKRPAEIAVSILAESTASRNGIKCHRG